MQWERDTLQKENSKKSRDEKAKEAEKERVKEPEQHLKLKTGGMLIQIRQLALMEGGGNGKMAQ